MKKTILFLSVILLGSPLLQAQTADTIQNSGFENWHVPIGIPADHPLPVDWNGIKNSDNAIISSLAPVNWERCDTAHSGKYSLKLFNVSSMGLVATGTMSNGRYHAEMNADDSYVYTDISNPLFNTPFTARPDSLVGWFMCKSVSGDRGNVLAILHTGYARSPVLNGDSSTWVAKASFDLPGSNINKWTRFSVPFKYYSNSNPQYILIILTSGNGKHAIAGSSAKFDDLNVVFNNSTGIKHFQKGALNVFANNNKLHLELKNAMRGVYKIRVLNILGRVQAVTTMKSGENKIIDIFLPSGIYIVQAENSDNILTKKILIH